MRTARALAAALLVVALAGCKKDEPPRLAEDAAPPVVVDAATAAAADSGGATDPHGYGDKVRGWNEALNRKDLVALAAMYAPNVLFYGSRAASRDGVGKAKKGYLAKHPDWVQKVTDVQVKGTRATFAKTVTVGGKTTTYAAYLGFDSGGLIAVEGDETTDKNRLAALTAPNDEASSAVDAGDDERCEDAAMAVVSKELRRLNRYCAKVVDGAHDDSIHCGGQDQPPVPGAPEWTFHIFVDHEDHLETLAFVSVDLSARTASEVGPATDSIDEKPIAFDPKVMENAVATCAKYPPAQ